VKTYRPPRTLLAEVEHLLATNKPSFQHSPLEDVIELLCRGRHYTWIGIYLAVGESGSQQLLGAGGNTEPAHVALPETRSKILVSIKLASRELGVLAVESDRENAFGAEDRVLLEGVADALARFLAEKGKYLVRKARQINAENSNPKRTPQAVATEPLRSAAVGEK
jgi:GAF domain-containing protein